MLTKDRSMLDFQLAQVYVKRARAAFETAQQEHRFTQAIQSIDSLKSEEERDLLKRQLAEPADPPSNAGNLPFWVENSFFHLRSRIPASTLSKEKAASLHKDLAKKCNDLINHQKKLALFFIKLNEETTPQKIVDIYTEIEFSCLEYTKLSQDLLKQANDFGEDNRYALIVQLLEVSLNLITEHSPKYSYGYLVGFQYTPMQISVGSLFYIVKNLAWMHPTEALPQPDDVISMLDTFTRLYTLAPHLIKFIGGKMARHIDQYHEGLFNIFRHVIGEGARDTGLVLDSILALDLEFHPHFKKKVVDSVHDLLVENPFNFYMLYLARPLYPNKIMFHEASTMAFNLFLAEQPVSVHHSVYLFMINTPDLDLDQCKIYPNLQFLQSFYQYALQQKPSKSQLPAVVYFVYHSMSYIKQLDPDFSQDLPFVKQMIEEYNQFHGSNFSLMDVSPCVSQTDLEDVITPTSESSGDSFRGRLPSIKRK